MRRHFGLEILEVLPDDAFPPEPEIVCTVCGDVGWVVNRNLPVQHEDFGKASPCPHCAKGSEIVQKRMDRVMTSSHVPEEYWGLDFTTYRERVGADLDACDAAEAYANDPRGSIYLVGLRGRGKTGLALSIGQRVQANGGAFLYAPVGELLEAWRWSYDREKGGLGSEELFTIVCDAPLLILDDLGMETGLRKLTDWVQNQLYLLINARYGKKRPTVFTSNDEVDKLGEYIGVATADRIKYMCGRRIVPVLGYNLRDPEHD